MGITVGVSVGVNVNVFVGVEVGVWVGVEVGVLVGVSVAVTVKFFVPVNVGVTRMINSLGVFVGNEVNVGAAVRTGDEVAVATTGAGTMTIPIAPTSTNANPLMVLIIKSLGYFISIQKPYDHTINQLTIQVEIIIGSLSMLSMDNDLIRLVVKIIDFVKSKVRAICSSAKTNSLIGYEEKTGVLGTKMILALIGSLTSQADRRNIQEHIFFFMENQIAGLLKKGSIDFRGRAEYIRAHL